MAPFLKECGKKVTDVEKIKVDLVAEYVMPIYPLSERFTSLCANPQKTDCCAELQVHRMHERVWSQSERARGSRRIAKRMMLNVNVAVTLPDEG